MAEHYVSHHGQGYRVYRLVNGLYRAYTGPFFATPKEAARYADTLSRPASQSGPEPVEAPVSPQQEVAPVTVQGRSETPDLSASPSRRGAQSATG